MIVVGTGITVSAPAPPILTTRWRR